MEDLEPTLPEEKFRVNEDVVRARIENLKLEQNLGLGIIGGGVGGLIGAVIWAAVTYFTEYQIGWLALGVGFLVGFGVSKLGKGIDKIYGVVAGVIALISVVFGNFLSIIGFLSKDLDMTFADALLRFNYSMTFDLMKETFMPMDLLFYGLAIYAGYRFSFRKISREELFEGAIKPISPREPE